MIKKNNHISNHNMGTKRNSQVHYFHNFQNFQPYNGLNLSNIHTWGLPNQDTNLTWSSSEESKLNLKSNSRHRELLFSDGDF